MWRDNKGLLAAWSGFFVAAAYLLGFQMYWCGKWWGFFGSLAALVFAPIAGVIFPFVYLAKVGFSWSYFGAWAAGLACMLIAALVSD